MFSWNSHVSNSRKPARADKCLMAGHLTLISKPAEKGCRSTYHLKAAHTLKVRIVGLPRRGLGFAGLSRPSSQSVTKSSRKSIWRFLWRHQFGHHRHQNPLFQQFYLSNLGWGPWWSPMVKEIGIWTLNFRENNFFKNPLDWISCGKRRQHLAFSKFFSRLGLKKKNINLWVETYNVWLWDLILGPQLSNSSKLFVCVCVCPQKYRS